MGQVVVGGLADQILTQVRSLKVPDYQVVDHHPGSGGFVGEVPGVVNLSAATLTV